MNQETELGTLPLRILFISRAIVVVLKHRGVLTE